MTKTIIIVICIVLLLISCTLESKSPTPLNLEGEINSSSFEEKHELKTGCIFEDLWRDKDNIPYSKISKDYYYCHCKSIHWTHKKEILDCLENLASQLYSSFFNDFSDRVFSLAGNVSDIPIIKEGGDD